MILSTKIDSALNFYCFLCDILNKTKNNFLLSESLMMKIAYGKILLVIFILFLLFIIVSCTVPPAFHREARKESLSEYRSQGFAGERVLCVDDNMDALLWRLRIIEQAKEEIILSTFDFADDKSGRTVMSALYAAAERGVRVRILVDGLNGEMKLVGNECFETLCAHSLVEAKIYNKINLLAPWTVNYRMHDKYLIADKEVYILGGRNTRDLFLGEHPDVYNVDRDILVYRDGGGEDSSVYALVGYFERVWSETCNYGIAGDIKPSLIDSGKEKLSKKYAEAKELYPDAFSFDAWSESTYAADSVSLLFGETHNGNKAPLVWESICEAAKGGSEILIQTPYVVCSDEMYGDLAELCRESRVAIITNAVESGANPWGCTDYMNQKKNILKTGSEVYEYMGEQSLHAKTVLIDDSISIVGSYNLDMRSTYLDTEVMLVIKCKELNAELREKLTDCMDSSKRVLPDGTEIPGVEYRERAIEFPKSLWYLVLRIAMIPLRHLL